MVSAGCWPCPNAGPPVRGYLTAFGVRARRCFAFSFTTEADGPDAQRVVAARVALIHDRTLATLRLVSDLDVDPREPLPAP